MTEDYNIRLWFDSEFNNSSFISVCITKWSREIIFGTDNHSHKKWKLLNHISWQVRLVDGNFQAGKFGERSRANSNQTDDVSFPCSYARPLSFHFKMRPQILRNWRWVKLRFTSENKIFFRSWNSSWWWGWRKAEARISKVEPECQLDETAKSWLQSLLEENWVSFSLLTHWVRVYTTSFNIRKLTFSDLYRYLVGEKEYSIEKLPFTLNGVLFKDREKGFFNNFSRDYIENYGDSLFWNICAEPCYLWKIERLSQILVFYVLFSFARDTATVLVKLLRSRKLQRPHQHSGPYTLRIGCGFFNVPQFLQQGLWDGTSGL